MSLAQSGGGSTSPIVEGVRELCCKNRVRCLDRLFVQKGDTEGWLVGKFGMFQVRDREMCIMD